MKFKVILKYIAVLEASLGYMRSQLKTKKRTLGSNINSTDN